MAALSLSAIPFNNAKFSALPRPLPPDITIRALPSSGRSDLFSCLLINSIFISSFLKSNFSISPSPPSFRTASKEVGLIVIILILSEDSTVAIALPA